MTIYKGVGVVVIRNEITVECVKLYYPKIKVSQILSKIKGKIKEET